MSGLMYGDIPADLEIEEPYWMRLNQEDLTIAARAINQGIDSHLEAVSTTEHCPGEFTINDSKSMRCFLRRLMEDGSDEATSLAADIMGTLSHEWI